MHKSMQNFSCHRPTQNQSWLEYEVAENWLKLGNVYVNIMLRPEPEPVGNGTPYFVLASDLMMMIINYNNYSDLFLVIIKI